MTRFLCLAAMVAFLPGCITTEISDVRPGMFHGSLKKLSDAYEQVDKLDKFDKESKKPILPMKWIEEQTGINFRATNVERLPGPATFIRVFGPTVYQGALMDPKNGGKLFEESQHYKGYFITHKYVTTETDRYYFSTKDTYKKGDDLLILFIFKDDMLFYNEYKYVKINTHDSTHAFAQGIIDILKEYLGPASAMYDLADKLKNEFKSNKNE